MYNVGIFIPIYFREELVKKCLLSLAKSKFTYGNSLKVFLCIGINGASKEFKEGFLKEYVDKYKGTLFTYIKVFDVGVNLGKPKMINHMTEICSDFTHMVSMDSDMELVDPDWLYKFLKVFHDYKGEQRIGALCSNQTGYGVHTATKYKFMKYKTGDFTLIATLKNVGIAGGVLITPNNIWKKIGGYQAYSVYGSDDGCYAADCFNRHWIMAYVEEIKFYHPNEDNMDYAQWKLRATEDKLSDSELDGHFEKLRNESI